jgi:hypothetical protein
MQNLAPADLTNEEGEGRKEREKRKLVGAEEFCSSMLLRGGHASLRALAQVHREIFKNPCRIWAAQRALIGVYRLAGDACA